MNDALIFDILLKLGGVRSPHAVYPPENAHQLQRLLDLIEDSAYDALKKDGLIYYLLRWHQDDRAVDFAQARCIPPQFVALADAYWYLDTGVDVYVSILLIPELAMSSS